MATFAPPRWGCPRGGATKRHGRSVKGRLRDYWGLQRPSPGLSLGKGEGGLIAKPRTTRDAKHVLRPWLLGVPGRAGGGQIAKVVEKMVSAGDQSSQPADGIIVEPAGELEGEQIVLQLLPAVSAA